ncbi:MAG TPA: DNA polymerase III subunit gamma/tau [Gaiellales bacterium]|nr:DNA polymerase III subunit gamma/tau [Gaiellales bacterium]
MSALYRIHRPQNFDQVVGQAHVVQTLRNAIEHDRVAHAYLFAGPRGTGKTSMAKILAKSLNCERGPTVDPCLVCESCRSIHDATAIDVIEMDAASHRGIDDIREIRDRVGMRPALGRRKVYIVDEAHMLTKEASNAVLKTLEEPPPHVVFVLCTTEMGSMLETIRSRCQRFAFFRPGLPEIGLVLHRISEAEGIDIDPAAIPHIARAAAGSFRDAVSTLDQLATAGDGRIGVAEVRTLLGTADTEALFEALDLVAAGNAGGCLRLVDRQAEAGTDLSVLTGELLGHLRSLFLVQQLGDLPDSVAATEDERARLRTQAELLEPATVHRFVDLLRVVVDEEREGGDPRLPLELAFVKICRPQGDLSLQALQQRLERLEHGSAPAAARPDPALAPAAPVPESEPDAPPDTAAAGDAARAAAAWDDLVLPEVARRSPPLHALLQHARPLPTQGDRVVLGFAAGRAFARNGTDTPQNLALLGEVLSAAAGGPVTLVLEQADHTHPGAEPEPAGTPRTLSEDEFLDSVRSTFDAHEIEEHG